MARLTAKQRKEREEARKVREERLRLAVEQSRRVWLGRTVSFVHLLDNKVKVGVVVEVSDDGMTTVEYQLIAGCDDDGPDLMYMDVGYESELLTLVEK